MSASQAGQVLNREQRTGEEPRGDADVGIALTYSSSSPIRFASISATPYIATASPAAAAANQPTPVTSAWKLAPRSAAKTNERDELQAAGDQRGREVGDHEQRAGDRGGEQVGLCAALAVDDDTEARLHAAERHYERRGADRPRRSCSRCP